MSTAMAQRGSLNQRLGISWGLDPNRIIGFAATFISVKGGQQVPMSKVIEFLMVCDQHKLNPATKEVAAFYSADKGLTTFVMIDGWVKLGNQHPECDGWEFEEQADKDGKVMAVRCKVYRKDRSRAVVTPWLHLTDWKVNSSPQWQSKPSWMLSMKALKHGLRLAFGFAGIYDDEEVREIHEVKQADITSVTDSPNVVDDMGKQSKGATIAASIKRDPAMPAAGEDASNAPEAPANEAGEASPEATPASEVQPEAEVEADVLTAKTLVFCGRLPGKGGKEGPAKKKAVGDMDADELQEARTNAEFELAKSKNGAAKSYAKGVINLLEAEADKRAKE